MGGPNSDSPEPSRQYRVQVEQSSFLAPSMLDPAISFNLAPDDDPDLWELALNTILAEASRHLGQVQEDVFAQVGCCRHWPLGPCTKTGSDCRALPELDWSVFLRWIGDGWEHGRTGRRCLLLRLAIPGRTARHQEAAIHSVWLPTSKEQLYGFRKKAGKWRCTAQA
jgi:hypothetical protein